MSDAYRLDHVAIGLPRIADAMPLLVGRLGARPYEGGPGAGFRAGQWRFAPGPDDEVGAALELLEPVGPPDGFLHRFLERRGPGFHHVTFKVPSLPDAAERARTAGYGVQGYDDSNPGWKECFLHPKQAQGIVVQLAESEPQLDTAWGADWKHWPDTPAPASPPARLAALRLQARDEDRARALWEGLLGGQLERRGDALEARWPASPLALRIAIEPNADDEGPVALELQGAAAGSLAEGPDPVLGVALVPSA